MGLRGPVKGTKFKKTLEKEALRRVVYNFVARNMKEILGGLLERAKGVEAINPQGKVYNVPPDPAASKILLEYSVGKPSESVDITSQGQKLQAAVINIISPHDNQLPPQQETI